MFFLLHGVNFDDGESYMEYDKALIRTEFPYLYQINSHSGLTDEQAGKISAGYLENGYIRKKIDGYYIFSREPGVRYYLFFACRAA